jgi:hypothetical protein
MSSVKQAAEVAYPILDAWFTRPNRRRGDYVDIDEIVEGTSSYVTEMGLSVQDEQRRANMTLIGFFAGDVDVNNTVIGLLSGEIGTGGGVDIQRYKLNGNIAHPLKLRRVYYRARWTRGDYTFDAYTEARELKWLGLVRI